MPRPKESIFGLISGSYSANKLRKMGKEFDALSKNRSSEMHSLKNELSDKIDSVSKKHSREIELSTNLTLSAIQTISDLQIATMAGIHQLNLEVTELSKGQWALVNHFETVEQKREELANLKLFLRKVKKEIDKITNLSTSHLEYATYLSSVLREIFIDKDVKMEHLKHLSVSEMDWAEEIIETVDELYFSLLQSLEA